MTKVIDSQCAAIWRHLCEDGSITSLDAVRVFGTPRLGGRIFDLRELHGHDAIETIWETDGKKKWARYKLAHGQLRLAV